MELITPLRYGTIDREMELAHTYIVAPVENGYPLAPNAEVVAAAELVNVLRAI